MSHTPHELSADFPEHAETISKLRQTDPHFARLADRYHTLNRDIHRAETNVAPTDDMHMADMRKERVTLKDTLYAAISAY